MCTHGEPAVLGEQERDERRHDGVLDIRVKRAKQGYDFSRRVPDWAIRQRYETGDLALHLHAVGGPWAKDQPYKYTLTVYRPRSCINDRAPA